MSYTIHFTYRFSSEPYDSSTSLGFTTPVHCNYIKNITTDTLDGKSLSFYFSDVDDFSFFNDDTTITDGYGLNINGVQAIIQITSGDTSPQSNAWRIYDVTNQVSEYETGLIKPINLVDTIFNISLKSYSSQPIYTLDYLNQPLKVDTGNTNMTFGEEVFFFGNVETDIKATAFISDIVIELGLNEFNTTTNPTWDGQSAVYISEIGVYDAEGNLVGVGKLNNPISKDSTKYRTFEFQIDF